MVQYCKAPNIENEQTINIGKTEKLIIDKPKRAKIMREPKSVKKLTNRERLLRG